MFDRAIKNLRLPLQLAMVTNGLADAGILLAYERSSWETLGVEQTKVKRSVEQRIWQRAASKRHKVPTGSMDWSEVADEVSRSMATCVQVGVSASRVPDGE